MSKVEVRVWIQRPVEDVYNYVTTLDDWPKWRSDVVEGRLLTEGPMRVGTQARGVGLLLGRPITIDVEITALEPGATFGYRPIKGPLRTNNLYTFESQDGGTLIVLTDEIRMHGFFRVLEPLMPGLVRSGYRKNLERLKAVLEAQLTSAMSRFLQMNQLWTVTCSPAFLARRAPNGGDARFVRHEGRSRSVSGA